jgi:Flp pilus assembly protein TadG
MTGRAKSGIFACQHGAVALEMALLSPAFFGLLLGIVMLSLALWTQASLYFAAEAAARCAAVNSGTCGNATQVTSYFNSHYGGQPAASINVSYSAGAACCRQVTATYTYSLQLPFYGTYNTPLSATACFPAP